MPTPFQNYLRLGVARIRASTSLIATRRKATSSLHADVNYSRIAVVCNGNHSSYADIFAKCAAITTRLASVEPRGAPVALLLERDDTFLATCWAAWLSGRAVVPLASAHPEKLLRHVISNSSACVVVACQKFSEIAAQAVTGLDTTVLLAEDSVRANVSTERINTLLDTPTDPKEPAIILHTSGTTGLPKGVVVTHSNLNAQLTAQRQAWHWSSSDKMLNTLPLYHTHGLMNGLLTPISCGATVTLQDFLPALDVWHSLRDHTIFTGVPTMYQMLLDESPSGSEVIMKELCSTIRLFMCGSAPLPVTLFNNWLRSTGHEILERYGSTEVGMVLTAPLIGKRTAGHVGLPFPTVDVRLVCPDSQDVVVTASHDSITYHRDYNAEPLELHVTGPATTTGYLNKPDDTAEVFTEDGWYKTGDTAVYHPDTGFRLVGRTSVDVIKSGGYKLGALQIESVLLSVSGVTDCAVVGLPDDVWGERVAAVYAAADHVTEEDLLRRCGEELPEYSAPTVWLRVTALPRNVMGKVNKKQLRVDVFPEYYAAKT